MRKRSGSGFDWGSDYPCWVTLDRAVLECVRGSHNNRLIEVIIWQPRITRTKERIEVVVRRVQRRVRCGVWLCFPSLFNELMNYSNSHACWDLWVNTGHKYCKCHDLQVMMQHVHGVCLSTLSHQRLIRFQWQFRQSKICIYLCVFIMITLLMIKN